MKIIDIGKMKISPFEFDSILEVRIEKKLNDHSMMYACGIIKDDKKFAPVTDNSEDVKVKCENGGAPYFSGVLQSLSITKPCVATGIRYWIL